MVNNSAHFDVFSATIKPLFMPCLRSLSLRRWIFSTKELKAFLLAHHNTLRYLHLLGCLCGDDEIQLARWGGRTLFLTGIELTGFLAILDNSSANTYS